MRIRRYNRRIAIVALISGLLFTVNYVSAQTVEMDSLSHYLQIAAQRNPGLKANFMTYKAALQRIPQAGAYPDPELDMGFFLEPMDILGGKEVAEFKVMQMFPWFGTKRSAHNEATHRAQMAFEQFREARNGLFLEVYAQWYRLCDLQEQLANNKENKLLLAQLERLALQKYTSGGNKGASARYSLSGRNAGMQVSTGKGMGYAGNTSQAENSGQMNGMSAGSKAGSSMTSSNRSMSGSQGKMSTGMSGGTAKMSDVLRIQIEEAGIDNNIESLQSEIMAEKAAFNALLNRPLESDVALPDSLKPVPFTLDETSTIAKIEEQNPMLKMLLEEGLSYKAKAKTQQKKSYPKFGVGLQYMLNKKTDNQAFAMGNMNGKDMVMPMVSLSIPIFRNKYKAEQREIRFQEKASKENYTNTLNRLESELYQTKHQLDDASRKIKLYRKQEQLTRTTYRLVVEEFSSGQSDLTNVIEVQRQLLDYQLKTAEAIADYNTKVAAIQKLISFSDTEF